MSYTDSPLVDYVRLSPNNSGTRTHDIDVITIHCVVGQLSVETIGSIFAPSSAQASSNYGVGYDGRIGMYVHESCRSWCTSSRENDQRAITIEVASDTTSPYAVTSAAYNATIKLVADICKRNGIKELKWKADPSLIGQTDIQNMTAHRWFDNKACPGDYLYNRFGDIADKVNAIIKGSDPKPSGDIPYSDPGTPDKNAEKLWNIFMKKIGNEFGVAGLLGNIQAESACMPNNLQNAYEKKLGYTDASYTKAVDDGSYTNFINDGAGYGLCQWTFWSFKRDLLAYTRARTKSIGDLETQANYLCDQLCSSEFKSSVWNVLVNATSIKQACDAVFYKFERPADQSASVEAKRLEYCTEFYNKFSGSTPQPTPEPTPQPTPVVLKYSIGDVVNFKGGAHYTSSNATTGVQVSASLAKITAIAGSGKHPYHVRKINTAGEFVGGGVYGWVDESTLSPYNPDKEPEVVYTVKPGDTLSGIAVMYGTTWQKLADYNDISDPNFITVGQKIRIPGTYDASYTTPVANKKSNEEIAKEVIQGKWGNGQTRKNLLKSAGYDYYAIQAIVDKTFKK